MAEAERARATAGIPTWIIRVVLVLATYALLWYAMRLLAEWDVRHRAEFSLRPWDLWAALAVFLLAGVVFTVAARFPFPRPRFAWGRLVIAFLIVCRPRVHFTLWANGWSLPHRVFQPWWFDTIEIARRHPRCSPGSRSVAGSGARREAPA